MEYVSKKLKASGLLKPGVKPYGRVSVDQGALLKCLQGYMPLTLFGQGNLGNPNNSTEVQTLQRDGQYWSGSGTQSLGAPIRPLVGYPVILQMGFQWQNPGPANAVNMISVSTETGVQKNRIALFYDNSGDARFALGGGGQTDFEDYSLTVGDYYVVEAYFASQNTWKLRVNKSLSGNVLTITTPYPTVNLDTMSVLGQWYQGTYYEYPGSGIDWFCVYDFYGLGVLEADMFAYCDYVSADPYMFLRPSPVWLPGSGVAAVSSPSPRSHFYGPFRGPMRGPI